MIDGNGIDYSYDDTYTLTVYKYSLADLGDLELNNSFEDAKDQQSNFLNNYIGTSSKEATPIKFSIDSPADVDKYAIYMSKGDKISVKMDLPATYNDALDRYRIEIYRNVVNKGDGAYTYIAASYNNPNSTHSKYVTIIAEKAGTYYVGIRSLNGRFDYQKYGILTITKTTSANLDELEIQGTRPNDFLYVITGKDDDFTYITNTSARIDDAEIEATIDNELDVDWYSYKNEDRYSTAEINLESSGYVEAIVLDATYRVMSAGVNGNTYTFEPNHTYYIAVYAKDNSYGSMLNDNSYTLDIELEKLRSDLIFKPVNWGTFMYDNSPEYITTDDLADSSLGNKWLLTGENLTGVIDIQSSHSVQSYITTEGNICFDILLYNPTQNDITVKVLQCGVQMPWEENDSPQNATSSQWVCLKAWADYLQTNLTEKMFIIDENYEKENGIIYEPYNYKNYKELLPEEGEYKIGKGQAVWMFGENRPIITNKDAWSPINIVTKIHTDDMVNVSIGAFRNVNDVYSPDYPDLIFDYKNQRKEPQIDGAKVEDDVERKCKGIASSLAEVEAKTIWVIDENTTYFTPTVYNMFNPYGYHIADGSNTTYWTTHFNPNQDKWNYYNGVESDIIPLVFEEKNGIGEVTKTWYFDTRHFRPLYGNGVLTDTPPICTAVIQGNYGVLTRYYIDIKNKTDVDKKILYKLGTKSHAIVRYKWLSDVDMKTVVKSKASVNAEDIMYDIFNIPLPKQTEDTLIIEVLLPNADNGGYRNTLIAE